MSKKFTLLGHALTSLFLVKVSTRMTDFKCIRDCCLHKKGKAPGGVIWNNAKPFPWHIKKVIPNVETGELKTVITYKSRCLVPLDYGVGAFWI